MQMLAKIMNWIMRLLGYGLGAAIILAVIALAIFGFFYLMFDEWRGGRGPRGRNQPKPRAGADGRSGARSEAAEETAVDGKHHAAQE